MNRSAVKPALHGTAYVVLMGAANLLGLVKTIVLAKVLGADDLGYYGLVLLVLSFGMFASHLGIMHALAVRLPLAYGRGDPDADLLGNRGFGAALLSSLIVAVTYLSVIVLARPTDPNVFFALGLGAVTTALVATFEFYLLLLRVKRRLVALGLGYLARAGLALAATAAAGAVWGYRGAILAEAAVFVVLIAIFARSIVPSARPRRPVLAEVRTLMGIGLPLLAANAASVAALAIDRVFVASALPREFGQYTFATVMVTGWSAVTQMLQQAVAPALLHQRGAGTSLTAIRRRLLRMFAAIALASLVGFPVLLALVSLGKTGTFSEYAPGLEVIPIFYVGGVLMTLQTYNILLFSAERFYPVAAAGVLGAVVGLVIGTYLVISGTATLERFAWAFVASQAVAAIATVVAAERLTRSSRLTESRPEAVS